MTTVKCGLTFTATPYKKADYGLGVAWEYGWRTHQQAFLYRRRRVGP